MEISHAELSRRIPNIIRGLLRGREVTKKMSHMGKKEKADDSTININLPPRVVDRHLRGAIPSYLLPILDG